MDCAVLHGIGGSFCAGFDLEELSTADEENISNALAKLMDRGPMVRLVFFISLSHLILKKISIYHFRVPLEWSLANL